MLLMLRDAEVFPRTDTDVLNTGPAPQRSRYFNMVEQIRLTPYKISLINGAATVWTARPILFLVFNTF